MLRKIRKSMKEIPAFKNAKVVSKMDFLIEAIKWLNIIQMLSLLRDAAILSKRQLLL